jgi:hypothetical protein
MVLPAHSGFMIRIMTKVDSEQGPNNQSWHFPTGSHSSLGPSFVLLVREVLLYDSDFMLTRTGTYVTIKLIVDAHQSGSVGAPFAR